MTMKGNPQGCFLCHQQQINNKQISLIALFSVDETCLLVCYYTDGLSNHVLGWWSDIRVTFCTLGLKIIQNVSFYCAYSAYSCLCEQENANDYIWKAFSSSSNNLWASFVFGQKVAPSSVWDFLETGVRQRHLNLYDGVKMSSPHFSYHPKRNNWLI